MTTDEQAIRKVIADWMEATEAADTSTVLSLMADDVVFMTPGREPFDKKAFAAQSEQLKGMKIEGSAEPVEIKVLGNWAYARTRLTVKMTPAGGDTKTRSGYTLTIFARLPDGRWVLSRDANLLA